MRRIVLAMCLATLTASCETMSADECRVADWQALGYRDGDSGEGLDKFTRREKSCAKVGIASAFEPYMAGRTEGLKAFCQPERGFRAGLSGYTYQGVCTGSAETEFMLGYNDGRMAFQAKQAVESLQSEINSLRWRADDYARQMNDLRRRMDDNKITPEQRSDLQRQFEKYHYDRAGAEKDLRRAERDLYWREDELHRVRSDIGLRWGAW